MAAGPMFQYLVALNNTMFEINEVNSVEVKKKSKI